MLTVVPEDPANSADDLDVVDNDGLVSIILRSEFDVFRMLVEALDRGFILE